MNEYANRLSAPLTVDMILTDNCNHRCFYCYNPESNNRSDVRTDVKQIDKICNEIRNIGVTHAIITGGEPFSDFDNLLYLLKTLKNNKIFPSINSNLTQITNDSLKQITDICENISILVSVPGLSEETYEKITGVSGSFSKLKSGMELCRNSRANVGINIVVNDVNYDEVMNSYNLTKFIRKYNVHFLSMSPLIPKVSCDIQKTKLFDNMVDLMYDIKTSLNIDVGPVVPFPLCKITDIWKYCQLSSTPCRSSISKCSINLVTGRVYSCAHDQNDYGSIFDESLLCIWDKMSDSLDSNHLAEACKGCKLFGMCGRGCKLMTNVHRMRVTAINDIRNESTLPDTPCILNPAVRIRLEPLGYSLSLNGNYLYVSKKTLGCIESNFQSEFRPSQFVGTDLYSLLKHLYYQGLLKLL